MLDVALAFGVGSASAAQPKLAPAADYPVPPPVATPTAPASDAPLAVKVFVVNLFGFEAAPWLDALKPTQEIPVTGLSADYPSVKCTDDAVCQMTTSMGHANAAASMMAVLLSGQFDLRRTYFIVAGIAGIDPLRGTIGSVAWARYVIDSGIAHEIDARELPKGWHDGYFGTLTSSPEEKPKMEYHSELYQLDEHFMQKALALSRDAALEDSGDVKALRAHYKEAAASRPPAVIQCDTISSDTWWLGRRLGNHARDWASLLTDGKAVYCTSQQEDNALMSAFTRGAQAGRIDLKRIAILRGGSDFDRPYPGQDTLVSLREQLAMAGAGRIATVNLVRAGMPVVLDIVHEWGEWHEGVPPVTHP